MLRQFGPSAARVGAPLRRGFVGSVGLAVLATGVMVTPSFLATSASAEASSNRAAIDLLDQADIQIDGAAAGHKTAQSVASAGDVDGDGFDDVIVGARNAAFNGRATSGAAYVLYGSADGETAPVDLAGLDVGDGFRIDGAAAGDTAGYSVAGAGDVNGDGFDDVLIGAGGASNNGRSLSGSAYVVYGGSTRPAVPLDLAALGAGAGFRIDGAATVHFIGRSGAGAGDINNDGFDDVIVGTIATHNYATPNNVRISAGSAYVIYGSASPAASVDLAALGASTGFRIDGAATKHYIGQPVAGAGDVNGDGIDDLLLGAHGASYNGRTSSGSAYVVYGSESEPSAPLDLAALGASAGFRIDGAVGSSYTGVLVAGAGDINGDDIDDVLLSSADANNNGRTSSGSTYVVYGSVSGPSAPVDLAALGAGAGFRIDGAASGDSAGFSASGAGDVNGDGVDDVLVGVYGASSSGRTKAGAAYVVYGSVSEPSAPVDLAGVNGAGGFRMDGAAAGNRAGISVAGAGDVNGDGVDDVMVGAYLASNNERTDSGSAYLVYGQLPNHAPDAVADSYQVVEDATLTVATPGVLGNDTDTDGDVLTAEIVSSPAHGTVTLSTSGSFSYTPAAGYVGADSFTYRANDGTTVSNTVTVDIDVQAKPEFVGPAVTITGVAKVGEVLAAVPSSSPAAGAVSYEWFSGPGSSLGTGPSLALTDELEDSTIYVVATLSKAGYVSATVTSASLGPVATRKAPTLTLSPASAGLRLGASTTLTWSTSRATSVEASGDWSGALAASGSSSLKPGTTGTLVYRVAATNANGTVIAQTAVSVGLPKAALKVAAKVVGGKKTKIRVQIRGLAPREKYTLRLSGRRVATGTANGKGVATATVRKPRVTKARLRTVKVIGSLPDRLGIGKVMVNAARSR